MSTLREAIGKAVNERTLLADPDGAWERRVGALGWTDPLGALLWRLKYGGDAQVAKTAIIMLGNALRGTARFSRWRFRGLSQTQLQAARGVRRDYEGEDIVDRLAARALAEWVADRCIKCHGRGTVGGDFHAPTVRQVECKCCDGQGSLLDPRAARCDLEAKAEVRPLLRVVCPECRGKGLVEERVAATPPARICPACDGAGRAHVSMSQRAIAIGVSLRQYQRHWAPIFDSVMVVLDCLDGDVARTLKQRL